MSVEFTANKRETRTLPVDLTEEEFIAKSKELSKKNKELESLDEEKKKAAAEFSSQIKSVTSEIKHLAQIVETSTEYRAVEVKKDEDIERFVVNYYRRDTGEFVESRPMTYDERQVQLF